MSGVTETTKDLAPNGVLRAAINLGNPVLAQGTPAAPAGVTPTRQALGATLNRTPDAVRFLAAFVEDLKASGFIAGALRHSGQDGALVAPPEP